MGSGTTAVAARRCGRNYVGFELNPDYVAIINQRLASPEAQLQASNNQPTEPIRAKITTSKVAEMSEQANTQETNSSNTTTNQQRKLGF